MKKYEIVCITRCGFNFLHGERVDLAAAVTYHAYETYPITGGTGGRAIEVPEQQHLFIPRFPPDWNTL
jgi:hypothetical protein